MSAPSDLLTRLDAVSSDVLLGHSALCRDAAAHIRTLQAENAELRKDAERYRWLRRRMQIRAEEAMSGSRRQAFQLRIGHAFIDSNHPLTIIEKECARVDAAIDAALAASPQ